MNIYLLIGYTYGNHHHTLHRQQQQRLPPSIGRFFKYSTQQQLPPPIGGFLIQHPWANHANGPQRAQKGPFYGT